MKSAEEITLVNGNKRHTGRQCGNKNKMMMEIIKEERLRDLIEFQIDVAYNSSDPELKDAAQKYLIDKVVPKPKPDDTYVSFMIKDMLKMEDVQSNEVTILRKVSSGEMALEEAERLFNLTIATRKTFEQTEIARIMNELQDNMNIQEK